MENNELNKHKKSDTFKWIVAFTLIVILLIGMATSFAFIFADREDNEEQTPPKEQESNMLVTPDTFDKGVSMSVTPVSASDIATYAESGYTITATIQPATALQQAEWSVAWKNASGWASGKNVTDYVTITPTEEFGLTARLDCLQSFSEQIILTVTAKSDPYKKANCTLDYKQKLIVNSLVMGGKELSTETCNYRAVIPRSSSMDIDYTLTEGTIKYMASSSHFIIGGLCFTDEFIKVYNANNGSSNDITLKMARTNLSSEYASARAFDFSSGVAGSPVFNMLGLSGGFSDNIINGLRAATNAVGEDNVFKLGIFTGDSAISSDYVACDTWYKVGLDLSSVNMDVASIKLNHSGITF